MENFKKCTSIFFFEIQNTGIKFVKFLSIKYCLSNYKKISRVWPSYGEILRHNNDDRNILIPTDEDASRNRKLREHMLPECCSSMPQNHSRAQESSH